MFVLGWLAVGTTALRRLRANAGLALCALVALLAAVALAVSIPVYAEAANLRLLQNEISRQEQRAGRSPFALLFRYVGSWNGPMEWERVKPVDEYLQGVGIRFLGLPIDGLARHARTGELRLFLPPSSTGAEQALKNVTLGFLSGMDEQIEIVDGRAPKPSSAIEQPVDVLIAYDLADQVGINVGDEFRAVGSGRSGRAEGPSAGSTVVSIPIRVSGLWKPRDAGDAAWFFPPEAFHDVVLLPEATWTGPLATALKGEVGQVLWFARLSGAGVSTTTAAPLLGRIEAVRAQVAGVVAGLKLEQSPADALNRYQTESAALTRQLLVFGAPILALVLYFVALVAALLVDRQRGEIALLKTRGVRDSQIAGVYVIEWLILGAIALAIGPFVGLVFAQAMGSTRSFLKLSPDTPPLPIELTWAHVRFGVLAIGLALVAALLPALVATRRTLVDEQQSASRTARPPLWQRLFLDLLLLLPALYGLLQLRRGGGLQLGQPQGASQAATDLLADPLLVLVPVLLCFSLGLLAVRLIPLLLELLARLATVPPWTAPLVALRSLARQPGAYRGPLLLLILTLSLAAFSASMAATLDGALVRAIDYQVGAQTQLIETGESTEQPGNEPNSLGQAAGGGQTVERKNIEDEARFLFVPVSDHLDVPGVAAATRVGTYEATVQVGGAGRTARLVGIDRVEFPKTITFWDPQWAGGQSLGGLMNLLARNPDGVLVSNDVLAKGLAVGDTLPASLTLFGDRREVSFTILGAIDLWPGYYPQDGPIMIANLPYVFDQMGGQYPYDVWIARDAGADVDAIVGGVRGLGITVIDARDSETMIGEEQMQPRRQGLFGLLSVGFLTAGALTLLGFLLSALITARKRAIELGVLRALGMGGVQVATALVIEQVLLVAAGIGAGTGIGLLATVLVVPALEVGAGPYPGTPAFPPQIAWFEVSQIYLVFGVALMLALLALAWVLSRMELVQAVKLGDAN